MALVSRDSNRRAALSVAACVLTLWAAASAAQEEPAGRVEERLEPVVLDHPAECLSLGREIAPGLCAGLRTVIRVTSAEVATPFAEPISTMVRASSSADSTSATKNSSRLAR